MQLLKQAGNSRHPWQYCRETHENSQAEQACIVYPSAHLVARSRVSKFSFCFVLQVRHARVTAMQLHRVPPSTAAVPRGVPRSMYPPGVTCASRTWTSARSLFPKAQLLHCAVHALLIMHTCFSELHFQNIYIRIFRHQLDESLCKSTTITLSAQRVGPLKCSSDLDFSRSFGCLKTVNSSSLHLLSESFAT